MNRAECYAYLFELGVEFHRLQLPLVRTAALPAVSAVSAVPAATQSALTAQSAQKGQLQSARDLGASKRAAPSTSPSAKESCTHPTVQHERSQQTPEQSKRARLAPADRNAD